MSETKSYSGYIVVNWKDDDLRFRKSKPSKSERSPFEVPVKVNFDVEVPDFEIPEMSQTLEIPKVQVKQAVSELVDYEEEDPLVDPEQVLFHEFESIQEKIWELESETAWTEEVTAEEKVNWFRSLLSQEYSEANREQVVQFLEEKLTEYKEEERPDSE